jgi:hypothetical protein
MIVGTPIAPPQSFENPSKDWGGAVGKIHHLL